jgi:hypothetical protein
MRRLWNRWAASSSIISLGVIRVFSDWGCGSQAVPLASCLMSRPWITRFSSRSARGRRMMGFRRARCLNLSRDLRGITTLRFRTLNEITSPIVPTGTTSAPPLQAETAIPFFTLLQLACPSGTRTCRPTCGAG